MTDETDILELKFLSKEMIDNLTDKEREDLENKLGVDLDSTQEFRAVKKQFEDTRKRIREIDKKSLKILNKGGGDTPDKA